jgi:hypothetical protein
MDNDRMDGRPSEPLHQLLIPADSPPDQWVAADLSWLDELAHLLRALPQGWRVRSLDFSGCPQLTAVPADLWCGALNLSGTGVRTLPADLRVGWVLSLRGCTSLTALPEGLTVRTLDLRDCTGLTELPRRLNVRGLRLRNCTGLIHLPAVLRCRSLNLRGTRLRSLPAGLHVEGSLILQRCTQLRTLPAGLTADRLVLRDCTGLTELPPGLRMRSLDIQGCSTLTHWRETGDVRVSNLNARACGLRALPPFLSVYRLDLAGCAALTRLPGRLRVRDWIDLADTGITTLPASLRRVPLRWHGRLVRRGSDLWRAYFTGKERKRLPPPVPREPAVPDSITRRQIKTITRRRVPSDRLRSLLILSSQSAQGWVAGSVDLLPEVQRYLPRLPPSVKLRNVHFGGCWELTALPAGLRCDALCLEGSGIRSLPPGLRLSYELDLHNCTQLTELPAGLRVHRLDLRGCTALTALPDGLHCHELLLGGTPLRSLPNDLRVEGVLDLSDCTALRSLPVGLRVPSLVLRGCTGLTALPQGLDTIDLDLQGCSELVYWPPSARAAGGRVNLAGCRKLAGLPAHLPELAALDVRDCAALTRLPEGLRVRHTLEVAHSGLRQLPASFNGVTLLWSGVRVDGRIAFRPPDRITTADILQEHNAERRRVLLERVGLERFLQIAHPEVLDCDADAGGEHRLLRVPLPGDEPVVCVAVRCPSTGRQYLLRVPPTMTGCRQAVAWTAGFTDPNQYQPLQET